MPSNMHVHLCQLVLWGIFWVGTAAHPQSYFGPCYRNCEADPAPRTCRYTFTQELYATMTRACGNCSAGVTSDCDHSECITADGYERAVYSINRNIPGTPIHVCGGDTVEVDLKVKTPGRGEAIHWHGLYQKGSNWMDGVSMITQCPVFQGQTFRYRFKVPDCGTFFYHPHSGIGKPNGSSGPFVVRCKDDPQRKHYDLDIAEHTLFVHDWMHEHSEAVFPGLLTRTIGQQSLSCVINGRGIFTDPTTNVTTKTPMAKFVLKPGLRHRFRLINSGTQSCPILLELEKHRLTIIATDGEDTEPKTVDVIISSAGERYDFVVHANQKPGAYWMRVATTIFCASNPVEQWAIVYYEGQGSTTPSTARPSARSQPNITGVILGSPSLACGGANAVCPTDLRSLHRAPPGLWRNDPFTKVLPFKFHTFTDNELFKSSKYYHFSSIGPTAFGATIDGISFEPPASALLSQPTDTRVCDRGHKPRHCRGGGEYCQCTHVVKLPAWEWVLIVLVDQTDASGAALSHPFHMHGFSFFVTGVGTLCNITSGQDRVRHVEDRLRLGPASGLEANFDHGTPPRKDVILVPACGYAMFRVYTDNPGVWFFHCHFQYHMAVGMQLVFQVGKFSQFHPIPADLPRCGNYIP